MFKIPSCLLAISFAVVSFSVQAQEKSELFGQDQPSVNVQAPALAAPVAPRKVSINNVPPPAVANQAPSAAVSPGRPVTVESAPSPLAAAGAATTSAFQRFLADSTGKVLPIFGSEFFSNAPSTFAPVANAPVPSEYPLGPGDELLVRGWGTVDIDYHGTIDRNGAISIPTVGNIQLAGVKAGEAEAVVRGAIDKLYKGVTVNVTFGQLRSITVYVVGQARRPGTYVVSSMSTLVTALFASGGPNVNGSMRHVQVRRGGKMVAELDLYAFIGKGDKSADVKLIDGDTIYIPPAGGFVALVGKVNTPAIYELKSDSETISSMLAFAGGLPVVADPRHAFLERINSAKDHPRTVEEFALDSQGLERTLRNGDVLNITSITPDFSNAVVLRGNVDQPLRAPYKPGMRVRDLIPSKEFLITRASVQRQNNAVTTGDNAGSIAEKIGGLIDPINWDYAVIERIDRSNLKVNIIPFNLGNVFTYPNGPDDVQLQPGDTVTIFSQQDVAVPLERRQIFVRVEGEVRVPGVYEMSAGDTLQTLIAKAGGPTNNAYLFGTAFYREQVRKEQQANLTKAATRMESQIQAQISLETANLRAMAPSDAAGATAQLEAERSLAEERVARLREMKPTGRVAFALSPTERSFARLPAVKLENGDQLVIPARPDFVHVLGAVNVEASPLWRPNMRVKDYVEMAGVTPEADPDNAFVMRADGTVIEANSHGWFFGGIGGVEIMPGDSIVIPEKLDKQTAWTKFTQGTREWAQIFANFGLGAAAIKVLKQ